MLENNDHVSISKPGELNINNIQKSHEGDFICVASNVGGNSTYIVSVNVQGNDGVLWLEWQVVE